jgi:hypothetical protein
MFLAKINKLHADCLDTLQFISVAEVRDLNALTARLHVSTQRAVWGRPVQSGQCQKALDHTQRLAKGLAEQALDAQAALVRGIRERLVATPFAIASHCMLAPM